MAHYENDQAIVAAVADVSVDRSTGAVRVNQLWIAHDCGCIVNPDGLRNQIEGNAIQASSRALLEEVQFQPHQVTSVDWRTYPILRFGAIPQVDIELIDRPAAKVLGAGEATTCVIAPAIANAIFAADRRAFADRAVHARARAQRATSRGMTVEASSCASRRATQSMMRPPFRRRVAARRGW